MVTTTADLGVAVVKAAGTVVMGSVEHCVHALRFITCSNTAWGSGAGSGPWIMADLENGLFSGSSPANNAGDPSLLMGLYPDTLGRAPL
jgi:hypothetical protein